jgi:hypothetical protein
MRRTSSSMTPMDDVVGGWDRSPFDKAETVAEVLIIARAAGVDVMQLLASAELCRQSLQEAARQFRQLGMDDLAMACSRQARRAPERRPSFKERHKGADGAEN